MTVTPYPTINTTTFNNVQNVLQYNNTVAHDAFGLVLLTIVFFIFFKSAENVPFDKRLLGSLFVSFIASVLLTPLGILNPIITPILLVLMGIAYFLVKVTPFG